MTSQPIKPAAREKEPLTDEQVVRQDYPHAYESRKLGGIWSDRYSFGEFCLGNTWENARNNIANSKPPVASPLSEVQPTQNDEVLKSRDRQSFEAGFAAGNDYKDLAKDYAHQLVQRAVADRIDDEWLFAARDYLKKTVKSAVQPTQEKK